MTILETSIVKKLCSSVVIQAMVMVVLCAAVLYMAIRQHEMLKTMKSTADQQTSDMRRAQDMAVRQHEMLETMKSIADQQASVMSRTLDMAIKQHETLKTMKSSADQQALVMSRALDTAIKQHEMLETMKSSADQQALVMSRALDMAIKQHEMLETIKSSADQQTSVMSRALGKVIPVVMPEEWEKQLADLETIIDNPDLWPNTTTTVQKFQNDISFLVRTLPVWAEEDYLPRITPVRWAAVALSCFVRSYDDTSISAVIDQIHDTLDATPDGASSRLYQRLEQKASLLSDKLEQINLESAINKSIKYLHERKVNSFEKIEDLSELFEYLGFHIQGSRAEEIRELRAKLHNLIVMYQGVEQTNFLKRQWLKLQELKDTRPDIFDVSISLLLQEVMSAQIALAMDGIQLPELDDFKIELSHTISDISDRKARIEYERHAKALRDYQRWALESIKEFDKKFEETAQTAAKNASIWKLDNGGWSAELYIAIRDAMVELLLPIDISLLERPIMERFDRSFTLGLRKLDGTIEQTYVAEKCAFVGKKTLREFMENAK